ncbi:YbhB/YbcL family Raf kinase inhibitor-like protein [Enemella evansiae]|uniref:YbhB/YbcL family Raf kinase inhibitor-like protein n=1 Tax=Enemella evansiae TaxID=2016499 RepID=UPI000B960C60|nr:YbhB/YbcL family Raf kinase inhibitor-like protein [Enemella evansiae]OYN98160.1 hypothetical protein CGZ95_13230 [Enemella evansiae]OYN99367.1 hypothetical protein CGZ96_09180 [Enemella evansiae]OYO05462.1 hypothetical protein CGZ97_01670 [Enemella evansiae]PFG67059.1 hypothetical protein B0O41_1864 [Propionibacteriaceae bacterium ES.041]
MAIAPKLKEQLMPVLGRALRNRRAGVRHSVRRAPELQAPAEISLVSPDFSHQGTIPAPHRAAPQGDNLSPALAWHGVPEGTEQLLLIIEDIDAPLKKPIVHALALLDPALTHLPQGALGADSAQVRLLPGTLNRRGYQGPRPIPNHGVHRYGFHLYALDVVLPGTLSGLAEVLPRVAGHVLASGFLEGWAESGPEERPQSRRRRGGIDPRDLRR